MKYWLSSLCFSLFCVFSLGAKDSPNEYEFVGRHLFAQYYDCNIDALQNAKQLTKIMKKASLASGAHILGDIKHKFVPQGFSMIILLSESHASIHTYPEHKACFVDFFTCGNRCIAENFDKVLRKYLQPQRVVCDIQERK